jgi:CRP-like cAMP-binding protein
MAERMTEARRALLEVARPYLRAKAVYEQRRDDVHAAIIKAVHEGVSKSQVARDTGYTREYVTDLVKKAEAEGVGTAQGATN